MTISLTDGSLGSPQRRALWLRDALEAEVNHEPRRLTGEERFDVAIVGGGFTGMWTARELIKRAPGTRIALLEADICGAGASGRNGGFAMNWWAKFASLEQLCGTEAALELCQRSAAAVAQIGSFCAEHGIADAFKQDGWLWAATNKAQLGAWENDVASIERAGAHPFKQLDAAEAAALGGSPQHLGGVFDGSTAAVQPAMIARALREALVGARVEVYEQSPALSISGRRISSPQGTLVADQVVLALNAWSAQIPELSRGFVVVASDILVTDPIPDGVGPLNQVTISDSRRLVNYYRRTPDRRMMFGRGGGTLAYRRRITPDFDRPGPRTDGVTEQLWRIYPELRQTLIAETWSGPIDYSLSGLPFMLTSPADPTGNSEIAAALRRARRPVRARRRVIHRIVAYRNGAKAIREAPTSVAALAREGRATSCPGSARRCRRRSWRCRRPARSRRSSSCGGSSRPAWWR
jgi:glycine/D-amino acid oxidase-like deaminating enzyme